MKKSNITTCVTKTYDHRIGRKCRTDCKFFGGILKIINMSFSMIPVFLAFILNRCSIRFFTTCRCILGFTPFSASVLFGLSLVAILVKHPELYPCWLRRANNKILFLYELFASIIFIEIGYCLWNSMEQLIFYKIPAFLEDVSINLFTFLNFIVINELFVTELFSTWRLLYSYCRIAYWCFHHF